VKLRGIKRLLSREKYTTPVYDLTNGKEPLDLIYSNFQGGAAWVPMERCRTHMLGFTKAGNPFVKTLHDYAQGQHSYDGSVLEQYYNSYCPESMGQVLQSNSLTLQHYHAMATVLPWGISTPETKLPRICVDPNAEKLLSKEAHQLGLSEKDNYGWQFFGPVSHDLGVLEFERLSSVYESIKDQGYHPERYGFIHGQFLISEEDWVWVNIGGKHRFSSLLALDYEQIPVALKSRSSALFIRRSDSAHWPNVKNGLFKEEDALNIFDRIMNGCSYTSLLAISN